MSVLQPDTINAAGNDSASTALYIVTEPTTTEPSTTPTATEAIIISTFELIVFTLVKHAN